MAGQHLAAGVTSSAETPTTTEREQAALAWLLGFVDWERGIGWNQNAAPDETWKLGRARALLDLAGAPDRDLLIAHIAGTKGKGSTAAYLESIARAARWRTGLYTQPHLHNFRERIRLDGRLIDGETFARLVDRLRGLVDQLGKLHPEAGAPTTFELTTVLAILAFAEARVDLAIVEVGLGGRLDATNALSTDLSVITTIGLDHQQILGRTLAEIASEKAGIARPGQQALSAVQRPPARRAIEDHCREVGAPLRIVPALRRRGTSDEVLARLGQGPSVGCRLGLAAEGLPPSKSQRQNGALAVQVAQELTARGLPLSSETVCEGLARAWLPARLEVVSQQPLLVIDAAHNVDSARVLAEALERWTSRGRTMHLVIGMLRDKSARAVLRMLLPWARGVFVAAPDSPRAMPAQELAAACRTISDVSVEVADSVSEALRLARAAADDRDDVVVTGSFVTASEARAALGLSDVLTYEDRARWLSQGSPLLLPGLAR